MAEWTVLFFLSSLFWFYKYLKTRRHLKEAQNWIDNHVDRVKNAVNKYQAIAEIDDILEQAEKNSK